MNSLPLFFNRLAAMLLPGLLACVSAFAQGSGEPALGLIIGYRSAEAGTETPDLSPRHGRARAAAQWKAASELNRARTTRLASDLGIPMRGASEAGNAALLKFDRPLKGRDLEDAMRRVRLHPDVAWVEPDVLVKRLQTVPNDTRFPDQWHLQIPGGGNPAAMNLPNAWTLTTNSAVIPVVVAVVDGGVRFDHPELAQLGARLLPGYDLVSEVDVANDGDGGRDADASDPGDWVSTADRQKTLFASCTVANSSWHGTFITGQIAAASNNGAGVAGIDWDARILPVRVAGKCGALVSDLLDGVRWAAGLPVAGVPANTNPARVINLSFGGDAPCSTAYQDTINAATDAGALVVVAAGNGAGAPRRPADCQRVMAVASVRKDGAKADYSSFGPQVALSAPGGSEEAGDLNLLLSTDNAGTTVPGAHRLGYKQGTSFSAPQAVGVASLMLSVNGVLTPNALIERMKAGARAHINVGFGQCALPTSGLCRCTTTTCGAGLLDAAASVQLATGPAAIITPIGTVTPGTAITLNGSASVALTGSSIATHQWTQVSGPTVAITNASTAVAGASLPSSPATYVFRLTVTDDFLPTARTGSDTVTVVAAYPVTSGGGGGSTSVFWGMALWAWVLAVCWQQRRARRKF
ncbi:MAG: S8 family serine peptidase [Hydrogenophaga sp.]|uniref:S8 family peptidase n=1 Tax=Hydrogenophaga sp. TaxID=1904254 RepID=UPI002ABB321C|nr:S8 family serine peptidase [Hydrogenophaga sp.]MDZ4280076.1 S8 family serine peptidase [Hydrogenophaga sp.]